MKSFLSAIGFSQALKGFEADMVVLNPEWEQKEVPRALAELVKELMVRHRTTKSTGNSSSNVPSY